MSYRLLTHASLSLLLTFTSVPPAFAEDSTPGKIVTKANNQCYQKLLDACYKKGDEAATEAQTAMGLAKNTATAEKGANNMFGAVGGASTQGSTAMKSAGGNCLTQKKECKTSCKKEGKTAIDDCEKALADNANSYSMQATSLDGAAAQAAAGQLSTGAQGPSGTNSTNTTAGDTRPATKAAEGGGGSGMGSMMGTMLPMAMIGAMMAMQASKDDDKEQQQQQQQQYALATNSALQPNGTVDCSKSDAGYYADCNTYLAAACQQSMTNGTFSGSPTCTTFAGRYCGTSSSGVYTMPYSAVSAPAIAGPATTGTATATTMPTMGASGEGRATTFCTSALAYNYCQTGGRANCPSCQNLATSTSAGCQQNPALCLGQTSQNIVIQARTTCPDDPIFANPAYSSMVANAPAVLPLPTVSQAVTGATAPAILPASVSGMQAASVGGRTIAEASGTAGPTSDITGQYGPSVFSTSTQAISKLCQSGQLNCP